MSSSPEDITPFPSPSTPASSLPESPDMELLSLDDDVIVSEENKAEALKLKTEANTSFKGPSRRPFHLFYISWAFISMLIIPSCIPISLTLPPRCINGLLINDDYLPSHIFRASWTR
jgi:hypothetical protein